MAPVDKSSWTATASSFMSSDHTPDKAIDDDIVTGTELYHDGSYINSAPQFDVTFSWLQVITYKTLLTYFQYNVQYSQVSD